MRDQMILLRDLNCPDCAAKLEKAVQRLPEMKAARVAFASGTLSVTYDPEQLSEETIRQTVRQFGLEVASILPGRGL